MSKDLVYFEEEQELKEIAQIRTRKVKCFYLAEIAQRSYEKFTSKVMIK
jgi:hypothetical protein